MNPTSRPQIGTLVRYHGSQETAHGDTWRYDGFCRCKCCQRRCMCLNRYQHHGARYRLKTTEHRADGHTTLRHVKPDSFTVLAD